MTLRQYLILMGIGALLCWGALGVVLFTVDPEFANVTSFVFFYASLALALIGTISMLACWWLYRLRGKVEPMFRLVERSFRFSFVFSIGLVLLLALQGARLLTFLNATVYIIGMSLFAAFLLVERTERRRDADVFRG